MTNDSRELISDPRTALNQVFDLLSAHPTFRVIPVKQPSRLLGAARLMLSFWLGNARTVWLWGRLASSREGLAPLREFFNADYYAASCPESARSLVPGLWHYVFVGFRKGLNPSARFDTKAYLESNGDVATAQVNPLLHYLVEGRREGRRCVPPKSGEGFCP